MSPTHNKHMALRPTTSDAPTRLQTVIASGAGATSVDSGWDVSTPLLLPSIVQLPPFPPVSTASSYFVGSSGYDAGLRVKEQAMKMFSHGAVVSVDCGSWRDPPAEDGSAARHDEGPGCAADAGASAGSGAPAGAVACGASAVCSRHPARVAGIT